MNVFTILDHTKRKKQIPAKLLFRCPKCGKIGVLREFSNGDKCYYHVMESSKLMVVWTNYCYIKNEKV